MSFHFPVPRPRLHLRRTRVVNEEGQSVDREFFRSLAPAKELPWRPASPATPTRLSTVEERRSAVTVHTPKPYVPWEERFAAVWNDVGERFGKLGEYVSGKSKFDSDLMHDWAEKLRTVRVANDRDIDGYALAGHYAESGTAEMAGLQRQIRARILADALAATP